MFLATQIREQQNPSSGDRELAKHREQRAKFEKDGRDLPSWFDPLTGKTRTLHLAAYPLPGMSEKSQYTD